MRIMVRRERIVTDFDGTITDAHKESEAYLVAYRNQLAHKIGLSVKALDEHMAEAQEEIRDNPGIYGWEHNGIIVAPATVEPTVFNRVAVQLVIKRLRASAGNLNLPSAKDVDRFLQQMHNYAYRFGGIAFRDGAANFLRELQQKRGCVVLTNSQTGEVQKKLVTLLGDNHGIEVFGNAKKYDVDPSWDAFPLKVQYEGFPRPIYLRRRVYHDVLESIGGASIVIGDIYELDLALPEAEEITTVLVTSADTPAWEIRHYQNHQNGFSSSLLPDIQERLLDSY